nr:hypothetical protein B0A51_00585 [Rachicladosporium sp. CCFEE 5018]
MLKAHVDANTSVTIVSAPLPRIIEANDVLIKVECASCNPKDWKMPAGILKTIANCPNSGDDLAGIVLAALHQLGAPFGAYAEYARVKDFVCIRLPDSMGWEEAATLPMAYYMASIALSGSLRLCAGPQERVTKPTPLLIYGASTGVGSMAVKLAQIVDLHPLICVAGSGCDFSSEHIDESKGDVVIDYRQGDDATIEAIKSVLGERKLEYAFDAVSEEYSLANVIKVLDSKHGKLALTLPGRSSNLPKELHISHVMAGSLWTKLSGIDKHEKLGNLGLEAGAPEFAREMTSSVEALLRDGKLKSHSYVVYEGGLHGLEPALQDRRNGKGRLIDLMLDGEPKYLCSDPAIAVSIAGGLYSVQALASPSTIAVVLDALQKRKGDQPRPVGILMQQSTAELNLRIEASRSPESNIMRNASSFAFAFKSDEAKVV